MALQERDPREERLESQKHGRHKNEHKLAAKVRSCAKSPLPEGVINDEEGDMDVTDISEWELEENPGDSGMQTGAHRRASKGTGSDESTDIEGKTILSGAIERTREGGESRASSSSRKRKTPTPSIKGSSEDEDDMYDAEGKKVEQKRGGGTARCKARKPGRLLTTGKGILIRERIANTKKLKGLNEEINIPGKDPRSRIQRGKSLRRQEDGEERGVNGNTPTTPHR